MIYQQVFLTIYGAYLIILSIITFFFYLSDKKRAERGRERIRERTLLWLSFLGGAFLGYPAMLIFRHKTKGEHWYFTFVNILAIILHTGAFIALYILL